MLKHPVQLDNMVNCMEKNINKCERKLNKLKLIRGLELVNKSEQIIEEGFITGLNEKWIYVYLPKYKLEEKIRLVPLKFKELYKVESHDNDKSIKLYKNDELEVEYKLYQKLKVEITPFLNESLFQNKIKIRPIITELSSGEPIRRQNSQKS